MRHTSGQKPTTLFAPVFLLALLAGIVVGAIVGGLIALSSITEAANNPEEFAAWGEPSGYALFLVIYGAVAGGIVALAPAVGTFLGLFLHSGMVPLPTVNQQALAAGLGAAAGSTMVAALFVILNGEELMAATLIAGGFVLASFLIAFLVGRKYLGYLEARDEATIRVSRELA